MAELTAGFVVLGDGVCSGASARLRRPGSGEREGGSELRSGAMRGNGDRSIDRSRCTNSWCPSKEFKTLESSRNKLKVIRKQDAPLSPQRQVGPSVMSEVGIVLWLA
jgi:hypothetical protein